jgi:hypothetical protein
VRDPVDSWRLRARNPSIHPISASLRVVPSPLHGYQNLWLYSQVTVEVEASATPPGRRKTSDVHRGKFQSIIDCLKVVRHRAGGLPGLEVPFRLGLIGFEASGSVDARELNGTSPEKRWMGYLLSAAGSLRYVAANGDRRCREIRHGVARDQTRTRSRTRHLPIPYALTHREAATDLLGSAWVVAGEVIRLPPQPRPPPLRWRSPGAEATRVNRRHIDGVL